MRIAGQPSIQLSPGGGKSDRLLSRKRGITSDLPARGLSRMAMTNDFSACFIALSRMASSSIRIEVGVARSCKIAMLRKHH